MAQTTEVSKLLSDSTGQEVKGQTVESEGGGVEVAGIKHVDESSSSTLSVALAGPHAEKTSSQNSADAQSNAPSSRPSLVPLGSNHVQTSSLTPVAPHPKRFSAVNINKKFLEKNTASGSTASSSSSSIVKSGSPASTPVVSSSTAGWSRPSSVAPSPATATNSPSSTSPLPIAALAVPPSTTGAPLLPHVGKVILPQPKTAVAQLGSSQKDTGTVKHVWGNVKPPAAPVRSDIEPSDFPTAAEVANGKPFSQIYTEEAKTSSDTAAKQLRSEEADAFRGVHLDPNVHHWDEMEEDDDNFLGGVIEFGDGRQYKIESSEPHQAGASPARSLTRPHADETREPPSRPVSKEDRFVDDFDRSWPKSRNSPASTSKDVAPSPAPQSASPSISPVISHAAHSPQDSSRVLFNERSNRLEPYSQGHRPGQGPFSSKRSNHQDGLSPIAEPRSAREVSHNVQVLQKPTGGDLGPRGRRFSGSGGGFGSAPSNGFIGDKHRDREQPSRRDAPPPSPRREHQSIDTGGREFPDRGRRNMMGPPPVPAHAGQKDGGRQLPPHLSQVSPNIPQRRLSSRDSRFSPSETSANLPQSTSARIPPHSPAVSHASLTLVSPATTANPALPLSAPELDEVRKDVMHTAAERAKQRRQQEEQEREAQKERARRKAAELEEKMVAAEAEKQKQKQQEAEVAAKAAEKEQEAIGVIEDALQSVESSAKSTSGVATRPLGVIPPRPAPLSTSPSVQTESWRARTNPVSPRQIQPRPPTSANFIASGPSAAEQVESIADGSKDDLEVVDFSDMGKFVGVPDAPESPPASTNDAPVATSILARLQRPVASDFFEEPIATEVPISASKEAGFGAWRRKVSQDTNELPSINMLNDVKKGAAEETKKADSSFITSGPTSQDQAHVREHSFSPDGSATSAKESLNHQDQVHGGQTVHVPQNLNSQRTPRSQTFYKEATMSALDDAMSRIKGVLVGMHAQEVPKETPPSGSADQEMQPTRMNQPPHLPQTPLRFSTKDRWVPPALRPRKYDDTDEPREVFLVTVLQPPRTPSPISHIIVRLPSLSRPVEFISKKQLHAFSRPPYQPRMDILSFDPPVYDMNRRDLSLNDVLFRRPPAAYKGKFKYRVVLPRFRGPKVNMPSLSLTKPNAVGAFGRPTGADGATTWRKAVVSPTSPTSTADLTKDLVELNTTSRSPPPQGSPPEANVTSIPKSNENSPTKSEHNPAVRSRSQPKMPEGSAVAFIRDSRIDVVEADTKPLVNFIIGSQLEEPGTSGFQKVALSQKVPASNSIDMKSAPNTGTNGIMNSLSTSSDERTPSFASTKAESPDPSNDPILITPPARHPTASWARSSVSLPIKDSPARAPDPEHLKAVWSQTSNKAGLHPVNSLEGIADDLTALPFTLQDVKSEDGETPPPSLPNAPSRMSIHEVTRAFQTVPTSSSAPNQPPLRATFSPPSTHAPVARPTTAATYAYSPAPQNNMRPAYVPYPSPMMSHSPAPVMYGHPMAASPVPSRMQLNGHTPLYSQPMWMTMPGPSPQTHGGMIRPVASPYPPQMMPYPSPGYAPQPPPNMMAAVTSQGQNPGRGRGIPVMSPVMSHAHAHPGSAMYASSPVMMQAVQVPQNHGYLPMPAGRGQPPRTENGQMPLQQQSSHHNHHPPSHTGYNNPTPASSFVRPAW
ncbi:hypothetical protein GALMADRAFT_53483 [Galerina marginata CBS 339.88]|uniref:Uncharacterized protein n=1 Tax=Galerina marginata (strain CBS 339.88) TaxID=685588 RepID=A0A067U0D1_GALM3|nr:hypothetical protein GALMADRAFT_53483 [Galerina marginata CBS 339.88]